MSVTGELVVADPEKGRVCVFALESGELTREWGVVGQNDGEFQEPSTLAASGVHLYVMDGLGTSNRIQVFE